LKPSSQELFSALPEEIVNHIQHLERMRQDFVANLSHELRTPLTVIHGYLETLLDQNTPVDPKWHKIFHQMNQQTLRMENLIEDLLLLSRIECHEHEKAESKIVVVPAMLQTIFHVAKELSGELNHNIQLKIDNTIGLTGYTEELHSLFSNIIFNAVKYTPAHGSITIEWAARNNQAELSVHDTGIGIATEHIPRLTERFYRVDPARSRASGGTGLGLAIAKHVLIHHQANMDIQSQIGKGSVFTCIFPKERTVKLAITSIKDGNS
jgi:two-component system phosphate regulon sensor histidine kinase PhoR